MKWKIVFISLIFAGFAVMTCTKGSPPVQVKGSDTLVNLVQVLAEQYMDKNPGTAIAVTGGGSGVGIAAIINGTVDIANHSRPLKDKEFKEFEEKGIIPTTLVIGIDGLSVIVNENNPVDSLSMEDIGKIYRGELDTWNQIGGSDEDISTYGRQPNSGTYVFFQDLVLGKKDYSPKMKQMNGNAQIMDAVKTDANSIGYVGVGYVYDERDNVQKGIKVLKVSLSDGPAYAPTNVDDVKSGRYPIARPLFQTINGKPKGAVKDFVAFELGPEGQKIVEEQGFFPIGGEYIEANKKAGF
ncbi:MAG: phosphate ABC transporter substrate-binding protein [Gemmatimonadota bacterium]|nr:MAG: phosphate ABC transporter substrate-binding protein [Gemmatimonadota bacterium]